MAAPKKKKLTQREKTLNARVKKQLQEEGVLPPDKPKLNRKKFAKEVLEEWGEMDTYGGQSVAWYRRTCERLTLNKSGFSSF